MSRYNRRLPASQQRHLAGIRATSEGGECTRCHEPIVKEQRIVSAGMGRWMHAGCASGADDE